MAEVVPGVAVFAVILAHRAPLTLAQIGSPSLPRRLPVPCFLEPAVFGGLSHFFLLKSTAAFTRQAFQKFRRLTASASPRQHPASSISTPTRRPRHDNARR